MKQTNYRRPNASVPCDLYLIRLRMGVELDFVKMLGNCRCVLVLLGRFK